jgi:hypothetical protein
MTGKLDQAARDFTNLRDLDACVSGGADRL